MRTRSVSLTVIVLVLLAFIVVGCGEKLPSEPKGEIPEYSIINYEDISVARAKRYILAIHVPGQPTMDDLKLIAQKAACEFAKDSNFNSLTMWFYDYAEYYKRSGFPLGEVTYAPKGDIAEAMNIQAGEYDKMSFNYEKLKEKDWSKQLTPEEVEVWKVFYDDMKEVGEEKAEVITAQETGKSPEEIAAIFMKQAIWTY